MGLDACLDCGKMISTECKQCPHCGKPEPTKSYRERQAVIKYNQESGQRMLRLFGLGVAVVGLITLWAYFAH